MSLALRTRIPVAVWELEEPETILTALDLLSDIDNERRATGG